LTLQKLLSEKFEPESSNMDFIYASLASEYGPPPPGATYVNPADTPAPPDNDDLLDEEPVLIVLDASNAHQSPPTGEILDQEMSQGSSSSTHHFVPPLPQTPRPTSAKKTKASDSPAPVERSSKR
jgi:hypothetical protein